MVGNEAVTGGVRLVEPVVCKRLKRLEHLLDHARGYATPCCARDELLLEPSEHVLLLLPHRIPQGVSLRSREATECRCSRHDVFLVHEHAVRSLQEWLKKRVEVGDRLCSVLATNIRGYVRHGARSIQRNHRGEIEHARWTQLLDVTAHSSGFKLEDPARFA